MIIRNGIRTTFRAKRRSLLFMVLIFALTVMLVLGLGTWVYCSQLIKQCDDNYTSIALLEYVGAEYNDADVADEFARSAAQKLAQIDISDIDGVELWEPDENTLVSVDGYERQLADSPYKDMAVFTVSRFVELSTSEIGNFSDESLLPQDYFIMDYVKGNCAVIQSGQIYASFTLFVYDDDLDQYYYQNGNDESTRVIFSEDEHPDNYVLYNWQNGMIHCVSGSSSNDITINFFDYTILFPADGSEKILPFYVYDEGGYTGEYEVINYLASVGDVLYASDNIAGKLVTLETEDTGFVPQKNERYIVNATKIDSNTGNQTYVITDFADENEISPYRLVSDSEEVSSDDIFYKYAEKYRIANHCSRMEISSDIESLYVFQQQILYLEDGRFPESDETDVCVVSGQMAQSMGLKAGDQISVTDLLSDSSNRFDFTLLEESQAILTVVGITNENSDYAGWLWASEDSLDNFSSELFGYQLGRVVLDNKKAALAVAQIESEVPEQVRVTLFDQGYAQAVQPLETMLSTAKAVTIGSVLGTLIILLLFGYLFVGRQRDTIEILASLGTPVRKIRLWILSGVIMIVAISTTIGAVTGRCLIEKIISAALEISSSFYSVDETYSEKAVGLNIALENNIGISIWTVFASVIVIFVAAMVFCVIFLRRIQKSQRPVRGQSHVYVPLNKSSNFGRGACGFAMRSAVRNGWRSVVVIIVSLSLTLSVGILLGSEQKKEARLADSYSSSIEGMAVSTDGRTYSDLIISAVNARTLWNSGMLRNIYLSTSWHYWQSGEMPDFGTGSSASDRRTAWINKQPQIIALNGLCAAPEFYYVENPEITWLDGWDESMFSDDSYTSFLKTLYATSENGVTKEIYPAIVSRTFLQSNENSIGDEVDLLMNVEFYNSTLEYPVTIQIVGVFASEIGADNIYVPLSFWCPSGLFTDEKDEITGRQNASVSWMDFQESTFLDYLVKNTNFETCHFFLDSGNQLEEFRNYLSVQGFSSVGHIKRNRTTILLMDETFTETLGSINRYLTFTGILVPFLLAVIFLIGFVISWLMVNGRKMELALMRSLGDSRWRIVLILFMEQGSLCVSGSIIATIILLIAGTGVCAWLAAGGFLICYLVGCACSVFILSKTNLMELLSERE